MSELLERSIATDGPCDVRFAFKCGATTVCWDLARLGPANLRVWKVPHRRTGGGGGGSNLVRNERCNFFNLLTCNSELKIADTVRKKSLQFYMS